MKRHAPCPVPPPSSPVRVSIHTGEARKQRGVLLPSSTGRHRLPEEKEKKKENKRKRKTKMEQCPAFNGENIFAVIREYLTKFLRRIRIVRRWRSFLRCEI